MPGRITRFMWKPPAPLAMLGYFIVRAVTASLTPLRGISLAVGAIWLGLSIYDWRSGGRFMRWMYRDETGVN